MRSLPFSILLVSSAALAAPPEIDFDADVADSPTPAPDTTTQPTPPATPADPGLPPPAKPARKWV